MPGLPRVARVGGAPELPPYATVCPGQRHIRVLRQEVAIEIARDLMMVGCLFNFVSAAKSLAWLRSYTTAYEGPAATVETGPQ